MIGELPTRLEVGGEEYEIRTDYRDILTILAAFNDPELEEKEKIYVCLLVLYPDLDQLEPDRYADAYKAAMTFIDCGNTEKKEGRHPRVMDWEQDEQILFPAINRVAGCEVRSAHYIHWWTFLGYFMEISEGTFSQVLSLRQKKAKGKKLEKWEQEFWNSNKDLCVLKPKLSAEEQAERDRLNALIG